MTLSEFNSMDETSQAAMIWCASHIADRRLGDFQFCYSRLTVFMLSYTTTTGKIKLTDSEVFQMSIC